MDCSAGKKHKLALYIFIYVDFRLVVSVTSLIVMLSCIKVSKQHDFHCVHYHVLFMKAGMFIHSVVE